MSSYPTDRKSCGYAIRFIKVLLNSDAIRDFGTEPVMLAIFIASREDKLHYSKPPKFWRSELMDKFGKGSPKDFLRIRNEAVEAGLLFHKEGTKKTPGLYWTLVPEWLRPRFEAFPKRNGIKSTRSQNGTEKGTESGTEKGTHSITHVPTHREKRPRFEKPLIQDVKAYCQERRNRVNPEQFVDHYEANGWIQGKGKPIRDWKAAVRTWERNGIKNAKPSTDDEYEDYTGKGRRA
jgi:hypothetical protein